MSYEIHTDTKLLTSSLLSPCPSIIHGFTSRIHGDLTYTKHPESIQRLFSEIHIQYPFVGFQQVHGTTISIIDAKAQVIISHADGGVTLASGIVMGVRTADCIPLVAFDQIKNIIGIAHAGWRGVLGTIGKSLIQRMKSLGSDPSDIRIVMGPHIGACCYTVPQDRAQDFIRTFGRDENMIYTSNSDTHLDLAYALVKQCKQAGVTTEHIDSFILCTSCMKDMFYSYRREQNNLEGEMLGFIGLKKI